MNSPIESERNRRATIWIVILVIAIALIICYAVTATAGLMAIYPPIRTLVYGVAATDLPTPLPGTRPTRVRQPAPTVQAVQAPSEVILQSGILAGAPTLYDFAPAWQELTTPGTSDWNISFAYDQPVSFDTGWCATTSGILEENFRHISYLLKIDFQEVSVGDLAWLDQSEDDRVCRGYSGFVQAWPLGSHTVVMTMRLNRAIDDGWNLYPAGDYVDRFNISVTP
jgi:hypothetical protein